MLVSDSCRSSPRDITGLSGRQPETVPASDMYYGKPDEPVEWESPQKGPTQ